MRTPKEYLIDKLIRAKGDDLERAERQAGRMTDEQMDKPWGESGMSFRGHLEAWREERAEWQAAFDFVKSL